MNKKHQVITKREHIYSVPQRWLQQYQGRFKDWPDKKKILDRLLELDLSTATEEEVTAIIGNDSWTKLECCHCEKDCQALVSIGDMGNRVCIDCITEAKCFLEINLGVEDR